MEVAFDYKKPKNADANFYVIFGVCPKFEVDLTQSSGKSKPPFFSKKLCYNLRHRDIVTHPDGCATSHNYKFVADLLELNEDSDHGYFLMNIDNPTLHCIKVLTIRETLNNRNKAVLHFKSHCPPAPAHAYKNDGITNNKSLVETFYNNILFALFQESNTAQISISRKRFNIISFSFMFSKILLCKNNRICITEEESWNNTGIIINNNIYYINTLCIPHLCHIGGDIRSYTYNYLIILLYQSTKLLIPLEQHLCNIFVKFKDYNTDLYIKMDKYHRLFYFCESCLRNNFFGSLTSTQECATNLELKVMSTVNAERGDIIRSIYTTLMDNVVTYGQRIYEIMKRDTVHASTSSYHSRKNNYDSNRKSATGK